ncbi:hypothetical protein [Streptomyces olivaceoviridis]|uniref:Mom family adenine methylcarbamoylation protein n=1 Tax=Streptomyces olivaceoviridis TaxID=1921 RepID=UPI0033245643
MHHYSQSWPAIRLAMGLIDVETPGPYGGALVGVVALGIPMHRNVLTGVFPRLEPYRQALELSRLVLLDEVPANAESWFTARAFRLAAAYGIRGIVAHSDPHPRIRRGKSGLPEQVHPGHWGTVYQALGMHYLGRTRSRRLIVLPDGSVLTDRVKSKIHRNEPGHVGAERRLQTFGARPRDEGEPGVAWLAEALHTIGATVLDHRGNHRYALPIGPRSGRPVLTHSAYPYPKKDQQAAA